jgi:hypothetical protein
MLCKKPTVQGFMENSNSLGSCLEVFYFHKALVLGLYPTPKNLRRNSYCSCDFLGYNYGFALQEHNSTQFFKSVSSKGPLGKSLSLFSFYQPKTRDK